jgi:hypothetical protein
MPDISNTIKENRSFLYRCIVYMLHRGVRQFIDIGSGFIIDEDIHDLVHAFDPKAKMVYVDRNPAVIDQGNKQLAANKSATIICADIREARDVFQNSDLTTLIDFSKPVGITMTCITCFFKDSDLSSIMSVIQSTICDGSYIAVTQETLDGHDGETVAIAKTQEIFENASMPLRFRNHDEVLNIFQGLKLVGPGLVFLHQWHPELNWPVPAAMKWLYGGLAQKGSPPTLPASLIQMPKVHTTAFTSTSILVFIYWIFAFWQSIMEGGATSFQQLKGMTME